MLRHLLAGRLLAGMTLLGFPLGTLAVNLLGSLLIGLWLALFDRPAWLWLLATGFCGGFTTFSTFSADTVGLLRAGSCGAAALYAASSLLLCTAGTAAGLWMGTTLKNQNI